MFVTSKDCCDLAPSEAKSFILGYTVGDDVSCRFFQLPQNFADQFFFAKAFDHFAPIGPVLKLYEISKSVGFTVKVNGEVRQKDDLVKDIIFSPEQILSHMSQGEN